MMNIITPDSLLFAFSYKKLISYWLFVELLAKTNFVRISQIYQQRTSLYLSFYKAKNFLSLNKSTQRVLLQ